MLKLLWQIYGKISYSSQLAFMVLQADMNNGELLQEEKGCHGLTSIGNPFQ
jgi:hypothetical protein